MNERQLVWDNMRLNAENGRWTLVVRVIHWTGAYTARTEWRPFRTWETEPTKDQIGQAQWAALADPTLFGWCKMCRQRALKGHMHQVDICQGCATRYLGVVY